MKAILNQFFRDFSQSQTELKLLLSILMSFIKKNKNKHLYATIPKEIILQCNKQEALHSTLDKKLLLFFSFILFIVLNFFNILLPSQYTIAIIGTNDLHGQAFPTLLQRSDNNQSYQYGGLVYLAQMISILRKQYQQNYLYLDAGDQFQGGIQSSKLISSGQIMNDFFSIAGLSASTIGNHQFDFGPQFLIPYLKQRKTLNLAANLLSEKGEINFLPNQKSSELFELPNGIKIGVIGLVTLQTVKTTSGFISKLFPQYKFLPYKEIVIQQSKRLKQLGANAILIVSHLGDACPSNFTNVIRNEQSQQVDCPTDELTNLISSLPEETVHGVVQGHRHRVAHHYVKNVPYVGSINGGFYFNVIQFKFNRKKKVLSSRIEGPVPVCEKIFENIKLCNYLSQQDLKTAGKLINWSFHGEPVVPNLKLQQLYLRNYQQKMKPFFEKLVDNQVKLQRRADQESQLSNLFTNLMHKACKQFQPDFSFINTGGFRTQWIPGPIQYYHFYNMFPFDNDLVTFEILGKELIETMKIVQKGRRWIQAWNLQMVVSINQKTRQRMLETITFGKGIKIEEEKLYRGVSISYLVEGGDQFGEVIGKEFNPKNVKIVGNFRESIKDELKKMGVIKKNSLISSEWPRLVVKYI